MSDQKRILVTGATGKVGETFLKRFLTSPQHRDFKVRALCHNRTPVPHERLEIVRGSLVDQAVVTKAMSGVTHLLHMATCKEIPELIMDVTVKGMFWLLEACRESSTFQQFIMLGGDAGMGHFFFPKQRPVTETEPHSAYLGCYALSKVLEEVMLEQYYRQYDLNGCCLRPPWIMEKDALIIGTQLDGGPGDPENDRRMVDGLDWLIEQNTTAGSVFEGKLAVEHAVSMGDSVGGTGAVDIGGHEAIITVVSIHGHGAEAELHGTLLLLGGTDDVMGDGQSWLAPTYEASQVQTFFGLVEGADHGYIGRTVDGVPGGVETPAMIAWIRYWIYNDQEAKRYFYGDDCVMCRSPWTGAQRKNWQ